MWAYYIFMLISKISIPSWEVWRYLTEKMLPGSLVLRPFSRCRRRAVGCALRASLSCNPAAWRGKNFPKSSSRITSNRVCNPSPSPWLARPPLRNVWLFQEAHVLGWATAVLVPALLASSEGCLLLRATPGSQKQAPIWGSGVCLGSRLSYFRGEVFGFVLRGVILQPASPPRAVCL